MDDQSRMENVASTTKNINLTSAIMTSVLEETVNQFSILQIIEDCSTNQPALEYQTIDERFSESMENKTASRNDGVKFKNDFAFIEQALTLTYNELKNCRHYGSLTRFLKMYTAMKHDESQLLKDENKVEVELLKKLLESDRQDYHRQIFDCMCAVGRLKDEIEDFELEASIKIKYVDDWQNSKMEINKTILEKAEGKHHDTIAHTHRNIDREIRVHDEISAALNEFVKDDLTAIKQWQQKYESDLDEKAKQIATLNDEYLNLLTKKKQLQNLYLEHKEKIIEYKAHKQEMHIRRVEKERRVQAATKIQAWWRGTIVRKGLGRFRKKKDKKPRKKESGDKKN